MRAAIIRWIALAQREMQNYEPITHDGRWELLGIGSRRPDHDLSAIPFPVAQPVSFDYLALKVPGLNWTVKKVTHLEIHNLNYMFGLEKYLEGVDLVDLAETYHPFGYQVAQAKARLGYKLVVSVHENIPFTHERPGFRRQTKRTVFEAADHFFALSSMAKQSLIVEGTPADCISVVPTMGVKTERFQPTEKDHAWLERLNLSTDDLVTLFVGRLTWSKGCFDLLWAFKLLTLDSEIDQRALKLVIIGNGEEWDAMNAMVERLQIKDYVRLMRQVPYPEMPKIHNLADVFVLPSISTPRWQEQFGAVLAESMACGKPIVGTSSGSIPEVVGDAGLIAQANDYTSLAAQLKTLLLDEKLRQQLGERGHQRATTHYDSKSISTKIRGIYDRLMAEG
jgi:glycosyltransferase involved in cell wall biosynthesis